MELALMTEPHSGASYADLLDSARWAEANGLVAFARSDHYLWPTTTDVTDAFVTLGGIARETERIALVLLVSPITFRHPAVIAKSASTLAEMSGGRFDLGIGTGWMELEHEAFGLPFPPMGERFDRLEEATAYVVAALRDDRAVFRGEHYRVDAEVRPLAPSVGIIIGGSGKRRTPALAGRWADEYNVFVCPAADAAERIRSVREATERAGRDPDAVRMSMMGAVVVGEDRADYEERLRAEAAARKMEVAELSERLVTRGQPHGTPDQAHETLAALEAAGVQRYYVQVIPSDVATVSATVSPLL